MNINSIQQNSSLQTGIQQKEVQLPHMKGIQVRKINNSTEFMLLTQYYGVTLYTKWNK